MRTRTGSKPAREKIDNSRIHTFMAECQQIVGQWNEVHDLTQGKLVISLEPVHSPTSDEECIKLIADTGRIGGRPTTITLLAVRAKQDGEGFVGRISGLSLSPVFDINITKFQQIIENFNP